MNEVEKMYENAGVEKETIRGCYEYYTEELGIDIWHENDCKNKDCNICKANKSIQEYPPFTAEKQLELIKLLIKDYNYYLDVIDTNDFENSLAASLNDLWQDLTDADKAEIKNILELEVRE